MVTVDKSQCDSCGTCISVCPENAILLVQDIYIDAQKCISCGACVSVCPFGALQLTQPMTNEQLQ